MSSRLVLFVAALTLPLTAAPKRDGAWSVRHANGKLAVEASYRGGVPEGRWTSFYDNGLPAIEISFRHGVADTRGSFAGFLPDGTRWPSGAKLVPCYQGAPCTDPFLHLNLETLPPIMPGACSEAPSGQSRTLPRAAWPAVLDGARKAWPANPGGGEIPGPSSCIRKIRVSCAPDLDGSTEADVLVEVSYRILHDTSDCATTDIAAASDMIAVVAMSPPVPARKSWLPRGIVGYPQCNADVCPSHDTVTGFVLLPSGEIGVRLRVDATGGECFEEKFEEIRVVRPHGPVSLAGRTVKACR